MSTMKAILLTLFLFFVLGADFLGTAGASEKSVEEIYNEFGVLKFRVPVKAPEFMMTSLDGKEIRLQDLLGKTVLLSFFTTD